MQSRPLEPQQPSTSIQLKQVPVQSTFVDFILQGPVPYRCHKRIYNCICPIQSMLRLDLNTMRSNMKQIITHLSYIEGEDYASYVVHSRVLTAVALIHKHSKFRRVTKFSNSWSAIVVLNNTFEKLRRTTLFFYQKHGGFPWATSIINLREGKTEMTS